MLPRVKLQYRYEGNPGEIDFGSSYRESTALALVLKIKGTSEASFCFYHQKVARLFILKGVKPSPDRKVIKFLTFDDLFPPLGHSC